MSGPGGKPILGIETEYALLLTHEAGGRIPAPRELVQALLEKLSKRHITSTAACPKMGIFMESGGLVHGEATNPETGAELLEMCTPECSGPREVVAQQRAQEARVRELLAETREEVLPRNRVARASLLKCSIDAAGNTFSTHENYLARDPLSVPRRALIAVVWVASRLVSLPTRALRWVLLLGILSLAVGLTLLKFALVLLSEVLPSVTGLAGWVGELDPRSLNTLSTACVKVEQLERIWLRAPLDDLLAWLVLPRMREHLVPFLATRLVYTAPGRFETRPGASAGRFVLSPKARVLSSVVGFPRGREAKPVIDIKHLVRRLPLLLAEHKRLSVTFSDTNMSEYALWLKLGTTQLVIQMIEQGYHPGGCALADPLEAIRRVSDDPALDTELNCRGGKPMTALDIQRAYHLAAERFVDDRGAGPETREVLAAWGDVLDALESDPAALLDRLDWVAKQSLLEDVVAPVGWDALARAAPLLAVLDERDLSLRGLAGQGDRVRAQVLSLLDPARFTAADAMREQLALGWEQLPELQDAYREARKLDLKYHDIGEEPGYHATLEQRGEVRRVLTAKDADLAQPRPPATTRAWHRGAYLKMARQREVEVLIGWERVFFPASLQSIELPEVEVGRTDAELQAPDDVGGLAWLARGPRFLWELIRAYDPVQ